MTDARTETAIRWAVSLENECARQATENKGLKADNKTLRAENRALLRQLAAVEAMTLPDDVRDSDIGGYALGYERALHDRDAAIGQAEQHAA